MGWKDFEVVINANLDAAMNLLPAWTDYIPHYPFPKQLAFLMLPHLEALYGGAAGGGKVLYDDAVILTPWGFKEGRDLEIGALVNAPDGSIAKIVQLHPRKSYQVWEVHFHDGTSTEVAEEHLWLSWRSGKRKKKNGVVHFGKPGAEVITTATLKLHVDLANQQKQKNKRPNWPCIPICQAQPLTLPFCNEVPIDPYLLGLLIGDGSLSKTAIRLTSLDHKHVEQTLVKYEYSKDAKQGTEALSYRFVKGSYQQIRKGLLDLALLGTKSHNKFIPERYKLGTLETRLAILQGLLDTDGTVDERGQVYYTSMSKQLIDDATFLVQSLGGTATKFEKQTSQDRTAYTIYIEHRNEPSLFRLKRKKARCKIEEGCSYRRVVSVIETTRKKKGRCITVSHPSGLYLTNDFIVTHNSDALLMAALQYVNVPGYAAIILRKTFTDLKQPGALIDRAHEWLTDTDAKWNNTNHAWTFPSGAKLVFGYLDSELNKFRYQGAEFQFIGFDEVTQFYEDDYLYLFSRLRKPRCPDHKPKEADPNCNLCREYAPLGTVPLRIRAATNPGGIGHIWVKNRFDIGLDPELGRYVGRKAHRPYIPAYVADNDALDEEQYTASLTELDPVTREQLLAGNWGIVEDGRFKKSWLQTYSLRGTKHDPMLVLGVDGKGESIPIRDCRVVMFVDPAASAREGPGDTKIWRRAPSWTVIGTFLITPHSHLLVWNVERHQKEIPDVIKSIQGIYQKHIERKIVPEFIGIEASGLGIGVFQACKRMGMPAKNITHLTMSGDKLVRATDVSNRCSLGMVWLPQSAPWLEKFEAELFSWTGHPHEPADQIDVFAYAGMWISQEVGGYSEANPYDIPAIVR